MLLMPFHLLIFCSCIVQMQVADLLSRVFGLLIKHKVKYQQVKQMSSSQECCLMDPLVHTFRVI